MRSRRARAAAARAPARSRRRAPATAPPAPRAAPGVGRTPLRARRLGRSGSVLAVSWASSAILADDEIENHSRHVCRVLLLGAATACGSAGASRADARRRGGRERRTATSSGRSAARTSPSRRSSPTRTPIRTCTSRARRTGSPWRQARLVIQNGARLRRVHAAARGRVAELEADRGHDRRRPRRARQGREPAPLVRRAEARPRSRRRSPRGSSGPTRRTPRLPQPASRRFDDEPRPAAAGGGADPGVASAAAPVAYTEPVPGYLLAAAGTRQPRAGLPSRARSRTGPEPTPQAVAAMDGADHRPAGSSVLLYNSQTVSPDHDADPQRGAARPGIPVIGVTETLPPNAHVPAVAARARRERCDARAGEAGLSRPAPVVSVQRARAALRRAHAVGRARPRHRRRVSSSGGPAQRFRQDHADPDGAPPARAHRPAALLVGGRPPRRTAVRFGYVPQQSASTGTFRCGRDLVGLGLDCHRLGVGRLAGGTRALAARSTAVGAAAYANAPVGRLSGGEQQRLRGGAGARRRPVGAAGRRAAALARPLLPADRQVFLDPAAAAPEPRSSS